MKIVPKYMMIHQISNAMVPWGFSTSGFSMLERYNVGYDGAVLSFYTFSVPRSGNHFHVYL